MVRLIAPNGSAVSVPDEKAKRLASSGYTAPKSAPKKAPSRKKAEADEPAADDE